MRVKKNGVIIEDCPKRPTFTAPKTRYRSKYSVRRFLKALFGLVEVHFNANGDVSTWHGEIIPQAGRGAVPRLNGDDDGE